MGLIKILDDHIANQIAAGEVVERPASVVKELVENAIDAGSNKIDVVIEEGGLDFIRVTDNGSGMDKDDCEHAFYRHATSKISSGRDLSQIRTLGFRGEALPSIAAVSKLELISSNNQDGLGYRMLLEGGKVSEREEVRASKGTDIKVSGLFFNTPARLKYMKTVQTELSHVTDYMYRLALAQPDISFSLRHNGKTLLRTLGNGDLLQAIAAVYGSNAAKQMVRVEAENPDYQLSGFSSLPEFTRASRNAFTTVINGRYIRSFGLMQAIMKGYHTLLPVHRFPLSVLHLKMDPSLLDVNVHPAKLEVRFSKEQELYRFVEEQVRSLFEKQVLIPKPASSVQVKTYVQDTIDFSSNEKIQHRKEEKADVKPYEGKQKFYEPPETSTQSSSSTLEDTPYWKRDEKKERKAQAQVKGSSIGENGMVSERSSSYPCDDHASSSARTSSRPPYQDKGTRKDTLQFLQWTEKEKEQQPAELPGFPKLYPIGQMKGTYLLAQNEEGLYIIDQHAAHERINYEYYAEKFANPEQASQELLLPITIELTAVEAEVISRQIPLLEQVGVYLEPFGKNAFKVTSYPHWLPRNEEKNWIEEMIQWVLEEKHPIQIGKLREAAAMMCSCKASIKANQKQTLSELQALIDRLSQCRSPYTCPHGRPIIVSFSNYDLEKMFKRVM